MDIYKHELNEEFNGSGGSTSLPNPNAPETEVNYQKIFLGNSRCDRVVWNEDDLNCCYSEAQSQDTHE